MLIYLIKNAFLDNQVIIELVGIAFILDFISGITKAIYKKNVQSHKLKQSAGKLIIYFCTICVSIILQLIFNPVILINDKEHDVFIYLACLYLIITECKSISENGKTFAHKIPFLNSFLKSKQEELDNYEIDTN